MRNCITIALVLAGMSLAYGCTRRESRGDAAAVAPEGRCVSAGQVIDSTFLRAQAVRAMSRTGRGLQVEAVQPVQIQGLELGVLVSLVPPPAPNMPAGGGGLVWVDSETGCAMVLKHYV